MKPIGHKESSLKTSKKGNVTINPKKEDLMSENLRSRIQSSVEALKEAAKKKDKNIKAAKAGKRWQDSDGDGKWLSRKKKLALPNQRWIMWQQMPQRKLLRIA